MASKTVANAIDWYLDRLNRIGILPANAAMVLRDISAKQIGGSGFKPRDVGIDNFSKDQLAAIYALTNQGKSHITQESYDRIKNYGKDDDVSNPDVGTTFSTDYASTGRKNLGEYFSPAGVISTSIGRAALEDQNGNAVLKDTYDFDKNKVKEKDWVTYNQDGTPRKPIKVYEDSRGGRVVKDEADKELKEYLDKRFSSTYGKMRSALGRYGHSGDDPDSSKIHVNIKMKDIEKRLGNQWDKIDLTKPMSRGGWAWRGAGAGAMTAAPIGLALGAIAGAMRLVSKKSRKRWLMTMLTHTLGGLGIGALLGATGGAYAFDNVWKRFEKKSSAEGSRRGNGKKSRKDRRERGLDALGMSLAYSIPPLAAAALLGYGGYKYGLLNKRILGHKADASDFVDVQKEEEKKSV